MTHTALELLPHVLRAADVKLPVYQRADEGVYTFEHPDKWVEFVETPELIALRNALPGLIEAMQDWSSLDAYYPDGYQEQLAQRIIDAIRTAAPDVYAQAVAAMEAGDA